jgi:WhiB family redox-sensing transcriptional regulator
MPAQNAMRATRADMNRSDVSRAQATAAALQHRAQPDEEHDDRSWHDQANCLGVDPDLFFPERGASTREAKEVCRGCVVREECLEYALSNGEKFGIWGGMSERERRRLRRARALARRGLGPTGVASA